jgi:hypothetical protein
MQDLNYYMQVIIFMTTVGKYTDKGYETKEAE